VEVKEKQVKEVALKLTDKADGHGLASSAGIWVDPKSGLTWQAQPTGRKFEKVLMNWSTAKQHCASLEFAGYSDWRLPTIGELRSLIRGCSTMHTGGSCNITEGRCAEWSCRDKSCNGCSAKDGPGKGGMYWPEGLQGACCWYWSSSLVEDQDDHAWGVSFGWGNVTINEVGHFLPALCVRSSKQVVETILKGRVASDGKASIEWSHSRPAGIQFAKSETTMAQFRACVEAGACESEHYKTKSDNERCNWGHEDRDSHPMNCVDWYGADAFCRWTGGRLPTDKEWYAEASDGATREYPWGNATADCSRCVMDDGSDGCGEYGTWAVCSKRAGNSVSGLCDMSGNVLEWTSTNNGSARVIRGSSWSMGYALYLRASMRVIHEPDNRNYNFGFRCARSP